MLREVPITINSTHFVYDIQFQLGQWYTVGEIIFNQYYSGEYDRSNLSINSQITTWINNHRQGSLNCLCRYCQQIGDDSLQ